MLIDGNVDIIRNLDGELLETIAHNFAFGMSILRVICSDHHLDLRAAVLLGRVVDPLAAARTEKTLVLREGVLVIGHKLIKLLHYQKTPFQTYRRPLSLA